MIDFLKRLLCRHRHFRSERLPAPMGHLVVRQECDCGTVRMVRLGNASQDRRKASPVDDNGLGVVGLGVQVTDIFGQRIV